MNKLHILLLLSAACIILSGADGQQYNFRSYRSRIVTDTVPGAVSAGGIVINQKGEWLTTFGDRGDVGPGCTVHFIKSTDQGETWSTPYLPDGSILGIKTVFEYFDNRQISAVQCRVNSYAEVMISKDGGETFTMIQRLKSPAQSMVSLMNSLTVLKNGDLLLPCYILPIDVIHPGEVYGSGFYRSKDGGKTWGGFELAFKEQHGQKRIGYNESAFVQKADGTIVGFARVDTTITNNMWKVVSKDDGKTWSMPVEIPIPGHWPEITQLKNGVYLMVCGYFIRGEKRKTVFYLSSDGENFTKVGTFKYNRPIDSPQNGFGGGTHSLIPVGDNSAYILTFGWDFDLFAGGWYLDGCMIDAKLNK